MRPKTGRKIKAEVKNIANEKAFDMQSRKWALEINNPQDHEIDEEYIADNLQPSNPRYFCHAREIATTGTPHIHIYVLFNGAVRFSTLRKRFPTAHITRVNGTSKDNRDYIRKEGRWEKTAKADTRVEGTFYEFGDLPTEAEEKAPAMYKLMEAIEDGKTIEEIIMENPSFGFKTREIATLQQEMKFKEFRNQIRKLKVYYVFGDTGTGKTRGILEENEGSEVFRITSYEGSAGVRFDAYHGEPVLVFEEFHSQIPIGMMLNLLDIYPVMLPARYYDRIACYTTVYITSNIALEEQYPDIQKTKPETWKAFLRRINFIREYRRVNGEIEIKEVENGI